VQSKLIPYLNFRDQTREAMEFYKSVFGGKLDLQSFKDFGMNVGPDEENKIMHSMLEADNGITFMSADTPNDMDYQAGSNISMSLSGDNEEELRSYFTKLSEGGTIIQPLQKAQWGDTFGMCQDKFGTKWMVDIAPAKA